MIPISEQLVEGNRAKIGEEQKFDQTCRILNVFESHYVNMGLTSTAFVLKLGQ